MQEYSEFICSPYYEALSVRKLIWPKSNKLEIKKILSLLKSMKENFPTLYSNETMYYFK